MLGCYWATALFHFSVNLLLDELCLVLSCILEGKSNSIVCVQFVLQELAVQCHIGDSLCYPIDEMDARVHEDVAL